jgi:tetratricopeptide (TPR) repeat protein
MSENSRIAALRRRVEKDPTSIAFAQLAEEYRRIGDYVAAVKVCRDGLARHPGYLSAQVTLGRALMELGRFDEASAELEGVLRAAPDNLAAIRALADIHQRRGDVPETVDLRVAPLEVPPPVDVSLDATMPHFDETPDSGPTAPPVTSDEQPAAPAAAHLASLDALESLSLDLPPMPDLGDWTLDTSLALDLPTPTFAAPPLDRLEAHVPPLDQLDVSVPPAALPVPPAAALADPVLEELEQWLAAVVADRAQSR